MENILVIAAHPDDEVLGMGGYIAKLASENKTVHLLIVTDGSTAQYRDADNLGQIISDKKNETKAAAEVLGIASVAYGGLPDMKLDTVPHFEVNKAIEDVIDKLKPDTVFTHFWGDVNMDHRCVYNSTLVAVRPAVGQIVKELYCYSVPSSTEWTPCTSSKMFCPNVFADISGFSEKKYAALKKYKTELRDYPHPRSVEAVKELDIAAGLKVGVEKAEEFILLRKLC